METDETGEYRERESCVSESTFNFYFLNGPRSLEYRVKQASDNFDGPEEENEAFCVDKKSRDPHRRLSSTISERLDKGSEVNSEALMLWRTRGTLDGPGGGHVPQTLGSFCTRRAGDQDQLLHPNLNSLGASIVKHVQRLEKSDVVRGRWAFLTRLERVNGDYSENW